MSNKQSGLIGVIFSAFESVHELTDNEQCRIACIVVNIFESLIDNGARVVAEQLELIALRFKDAYQKIEVYRQHIGYEDSMSILHFFCESDVFRHDFLRGKLFFHSGNKAS